MIKTLDEDCNYNFGNMSNLVGIILASSYVIISLVRFNLVIYFAHQSYL